MARPQRWGQTLGWGEKQPIRARLSSGLVEPVSPEQTEGIWLAALGEIPLQAPATACIITLGEETLHAANLGDSGFIILRAGKIVFKSPQQQHDFNFPYQLGNADGMSDPPEAAATFSVPVMEGDIVVAATDGVFDNLFADEIARVAILTKQAGESPLQAAQHLAALAHHRAGDSYTMSPFGMAAQQVGFIYRGGKMDDITVVVSYVQKRETPSPKL
eukprot:CAMPEP_0177609632 /NCGR_PEP_ID=MMETSP0419_2-20121207/19221_1 /TAXON_ID=582737 /ORGANISM="Tetraselmis sp., Strain GSL018" /LENGTH=216 /DNA_ID=CAMNT_0019104627 /DNA_START=186 /DNA_END=836 /DNA_ORIENTATION=-